MADICGEKDLRVLSFDKKVGRVFSPKYDVLCTATLISPSCAVTMGSCQDTGLSVEFNTPISIKEVAQHSIHEDQYEVDLSKSVFNNKAELGKNWGVLYLRSNKYTGKAPGVTQGYYKIRLGKTKSKERARVVEYSYSGTASYPVENHEAQNGAQQVAFGVIDKAGVILLPSILYFNVSNGYGGGAPIISEENDELVGVSTHGGCESYGNNSGTLISGSSAFKAAINACLKN
jgi:hypothetical protein